jgi:hypothetical protein
MLVSHHLKTLHPDYGILPYVKSLGFSVLTAAGLLYSTASGGYGETRNSGM